MQVEMPFFEGPEQALNLAVQKLGGAKVVGAQLWPDKSPDAARTRLLDCLNPSRSERLDLSESMFILRKARDAGCHEPFLWVSSEVGYESKPLQRADEVDRLATVVEQSSKALAAALGALERLRAGGAQ